MKLSNINRVLLFLAFLSILFVGVKYPDRFSYCDLTALFSLFASLLNNL